MVCFRAMTLMKLRLKGAQKGHSLLKKKADALTVRFRQILKKIIEVGWLVPCCIFIFLLAFAVSGSRSLLYDLEQTFEVTVA